MRAPGLTDRVGGRDRAHGPRRITRAAVVERALQLADASGLAAVTIRRLAQELGVTPMALYWHFTDKDELLDGVLDRLMAELDLRTDLTRPPLEQLEALVRSFIVVVRAHPSAGALLNRCGLLTDRAPHLLAALETCLEVLGRLGFSPMQATQVTLHLMRGVIGLVGVETRHAAGVDGDVADQQGTRRPERSLLEALPPDRYPRIREAVVPLTSCGDPAASDAFTLELLLAGVRGMARARRHAC